MKFKFLLLMTFLFGLFVNAQNLTENEIMGEWKTTNVEIPNKSPEEDAVKFMKEAFINSKFNFRGNKIFEIQFGKTADLRIKELLFLDGENWIISNNQIHVGTQNNQYSTMHITVQKLNGKIYFLLPMMNLEMEKISDDVASEPKLSTNNADTPIYKSQIESVKRITRTVNESEIIPFAVIENPPLAADCKEKWNTDKKKKCTSDFISNYLARKFNVELANEVGISGRIRIVIEFIIDNAGNAINITASGGPEVMNQHAIDVMTQLPKFQPATKDGNPVNISYKLPLMFHVVD